MDHDTIVRGLVAAGVPLPKARARADEVIAEESGRRGLEPRFGRQFTIERPATEVEEYQILRGNNAGELEPVPDAARSWPFRLVLPWSHLISDNRKYCPALRGGRPAIILTVEYRTAKRLASQAARKAWGDGTTYDGNLKLYARVFFPNDYRRRDAHNFQKCAHDALTGIVYADDSQIVPQWLPAGVDVDAPRAEIMIHPYLGAM